MRTALALVVTAGWVAGWMPPAGAQQVEDESFRHVIGEPSHSVGEGPAVCIDEAHHNFHTATGRYAPFARLLGDDGYRVTRFQERMTHDSLADCTVLVIANPLGSDNEEDWSYPHPSAFTGAEIRATLGWIRGGGSLLLFADHAPIAGAARDLGAALGLVMLDVYVDGGPGPDIFQRSDGSLRPHRLLDGQAPGERIARVMTFTGQAARITQGWEPLLVLGPEAVGRISLSQAFQDGSRAEWPSFSVAGYIQGAARSWDDGRIVFLGEAAMCSAQLAGPQRNPMGMNHPEAAENAQFCLNAVRWLARDLG